MRKVNLKQIEMVRTTVTLSADLIGRSQQFLEKGILPSRNALIVAAVEHFLAELEQQEIDRQFAAMAGDEAYQTLSEEMAEAFAGSELPLICDRL